ncbi:MAG: nicotinamide-nucleotide amidohydrolase family protein [Candidatus Hydrogenedentota bacterium]|nr:MAG: nicotinamide-nucleotide amidohydrolase family protein [Candidatus Hydrogenedentota bacterium]
MASPSSISCVLRRQADSEFPDTSVSLIVIGSEIVSGLRRDAAVPLVTRFLARQGLALSEVLFVPDNPSALRRALNGTRVRLVLLTGGLGSTRDDLTRSFLARHSRKPLVSFPAVEQRIRRNVRQRGLKWTPRYDTFCRFPKTAVVGRNPLGLADPFFLRSGRRLFLALPGVPAELAAILDSRGFARLFRLLVPTPKTRRKTAVFGLAGLREAAFEDALLHLESIRRGQVSILPSREFLTVVTDDSAVKRAVRKRFRERIFTCTGETPAEAVVRTFSKEEKTIATAESCTGGALGKALTNVPGASRLFLGGVIAYDNEIKKRLLGVSSDILATHGAVSAEVALAMASGVRKRFHSDFGIGITGIAGPAGGSKEKPVGTVFLAVVSQRRRLVEHRRYRGNREEVRACAVDAALLLLLQALRER